MSESSKKLLNLIKDTSKSTQGLNSKIVSLKVKNLNPLEFLYNEKLILDNQFYILDKNFATTHIPDGQGDYYDLQVGDIVKAMMTNNGQTFYVFANKIIGNSGGGTATDYDALDNKPKINGVTLIGNQTSEALGIAIPTKTSDLINDSGFINQETDPTVPTVVKNITSTDITNWNNKSDFSGDYNDLTNKPTIPTKTSDLTNDSGFISTETDPTVPAHVKNITQANISAWTNKQDAFVIPLTTDISFMDDTTPILEEGYYFTGNNQLSINNNVVIDMNSYFWFMVFDDLNVAYLIGTNAYSEPHAYITAVYSYIDGDWTVTTNKYLFDTDIVSSISAASTNTQIPGAKLVYDQLATKGTYTKPNNGIPKSDLDSSVQASLSLADTAMQSMTILSYGSSTWEDFITAYTGKRVVYCRASSNSNPATGSQTRLAFMAYVNNAETPTQVEFQYYRSVSSHTDSQQGDQVFIYLLKNTGVWSVTTRNTFTKIVAGTNMSSSYSSGTITLNAADADIEPIDLQDIIDLFE